MIRKVNIGSSRHGNLQKHTSSSRLQSSLIQRFHEKIIEQIQRTGANKMLDAGCGEGFLLEFLYEQGLNVNWWMVAGALLFSFVVTLFVWRRN